MSASSNIFSDKDFENMLFNCRTIPSDQNLLNVFPSLGQIDSFRNIPKKLDNQKVIRYIIYTYDRKSPVFLKFMNDESKRKTIAGTEAGWKAHTETGLFDKEIDEIMKCKNKHINNCIIDFIRLFNDPSFALLITGYESYFNKLRQINSAEESEKRDAYAIEESRGKIFIQAQKMSEDLERVAEKVLNDKNPYLKEDLFCVIDQESKNRLNLTPERWAV